MITEIIRYKIEPARSQSFQSAYEQAGRLLQDSRHCLGYELLRGSEEPENWVLVIRWESFDAHLKGFRGSATFASFLALVKPFFHDIQEMKHYERAALWSR